jgi:hypothetical protein
MNAGVGVPSRRLRAGVGEPVHVALTPFADREP